MAKDEDFDEIINNMGDAENEEEDFDSPIDVVANYWKAFHPGQLFVKGLLIVEAATSDGHRVLHYESSKPNSEWEVLGMMESVKQQFQAQNVIEAMMGPDDDDDSDDEDD